MASKIEIPADLLAAADSSSCLGPTAITSDHVQQAFREQLKDDQLILVKADGEVIAAGHGFTSFILRVKLTWNEKDKKQYQSALPDSVILKALSKDAIENMLATFKMDADNVENGRRDFTQMITLAHTTECHAYDMFAKLKTAPPVPVPLSYATWFGDSRHAPMILLEDLGDRARVLGDGSASLTYPQLLTIAEHQANLHAWCLTTDVEWRSKFGSLADRMVMFEAFMPMMLQGVKKAKEIYPDVFGRVDDAKLMALFTPEATIKIHDSYKKYMPDILVHGDFWANNIMFEKLPDGSMGDKIVAFIDWQMSLLGSPMADLGRVFSMSVDAEIRKAHFDDIIKKYYDSLKTKLGDRMPEELSFDRLLKIAHEQAAVNCLLCFFMQDAMQALFAPGDSPEAEEKRKRMIKRMTEGFDYAAQILDITTDAK